MSSGGTARLARPARTKTARSGTDSARKAQHSGLVTGAARLGLAARGLIYLLIGILAMQVALGASSESTNRHGALRQISDKPFGNAVIGLLIVGFISYAGWRLLEGAVGHRDESDDRKRAAKRLASVAHGVIYLAISGTTIHFLTSGGSAGGGGEPAPYTERVMAHSGGRWLVGVIGLGVLVAGLVMIWRGVRTKLEKELRTAEMGRRTKQAAVWTGQAGHVARGVVFGIAGFFVLKAAVEFDPKEAKGLDGTLKTIAGAAYGPWLLGVCAVGLALFGVYSFFEARYRRL
jgi:protein-S-isoprenylcysteine O-methyltransferase Ste14